MKVQATTVDLQKSRALRTLANPHELIHFLCYGTVDERVYTGLYGKMGEYRRI